MTARVGVMRIVRRGGVMVKGAVRRVSVTSGERQDHSGSKKGDRVV